MKTHAILASAMLLAGAAHAGGVQYQYAPVVSVVPQYQVHRTPVDREVCWEEQAWERTPSSRSSATPTIVGAIIGGVVGNQFGSGSGRRAATAAGAALGGSIGRDVERSGRPPAQYYPVTSERCTVQRDWREDQRISGYRVSYEYDGEVYHTVTRHHPGDTIRVRVAVTPAP